MEFNYCQRNLIAGTATLEEFTDQKLNKDEDDEEFNYCQWDTTNQRTLRKTTATYKGYKVTLIDAIDDLTRHSLFVHYLRLDGSFQHDWLCFIFDDSRHYTSFLYQVQTMLVDYYLKVNHSHIKKTNLLFWWLRRTVQKLQELYGFVFP